MTTTQKPDHGELKRAAEAATGGGWYAYDDGDSSHYVISRTAGMVAVTESDSPDDAHFIALANPATVLSENEALRAALEAIEGDSTDPGAREVARAALKENTHA